RVVCAEELFVHHFGQASVGRLAQTDEYGPLFEANRGRWEAKWGIPWQANRHRRSRSYQQLIVRLQEVVNAAVPAGSIVLVVSKGDDELLNLGPRHAQHFPQTPDGRYAGYHPRTSEAAISALEAQRKAGARFLVFPATALWWIAHYACFTDHLDRQYS